ncbi:hypothetical protein MESS4_120121 [Mesorhizobium sp. STM 4661]|nr:hypothetical protein MESS4_120121 [Mesorhizobium sp. STM 4661]
MERRPDHRAGRRAPPRGASATCSEGRYEAHRGYRVFGVNIVANFLNILRGSRREYDRHLFAVFAAIFGLQPVKNLVGRNTGAALDTGPDVLTKRGKLGLPLRFTFLEQAQAIAQNFAGAGIAAAPDQLAHQGLVARANVVT